MKGLLGVGVKVSAAAEATAAASSTGSTGSKSSTSGSGSSGSGSSVAIPTNPDGCPSGTVITQNGGDEDPDNEGFGPSDGDGCI
jgi:hypothetical protein